MHNKRFCVYNETRSSFVSLGVTVVDSAFGSLDKVNDKLLIKLEAGLWLPTSKVADAATILSAFDLLYLDEEDRVLQRIELSNTKARAGLAPSDPRAASALILAPESIQSSRTLIGDQMIICVAEEMVRYLAYTAPPIASAPAPTPAPVVADTVSAQTPAAEPTAASLPVAPPAVPESVPLAPAVPDPFPAAQAASEPYADSFEAQPRRSIAPVPVPTPPAPAAPAQSRYPAMDTPIPAPAPYQSGNAQNGVAMRAPARFVEAELGVEDSLPAPQPPARQPAAELPAAPEMPAPQPVAPQASFPQAPAPQKGAPMSLFQNAGPAMPEPQAPPLHRTWDEDDDEEYDEYDDYDEEGYDDEYDDSEEDPEKAAAMERNSWKARLLRWLVDLPTPARRLSYPGLVAFYWTGGAPQSYIVGNISSTGVYLVTKERWTPGTVIMMTLQMTDLEDEEKQDAITVMSQVVRWGPDGVGLQFVPPDPKASGGTSTGEYGADKKTLEVFLRKVKPARV